jgi:hypothetical protein
MSPYGQEQLDLQTYKTLMSDVDNTFSRYRNANISEDGKRELANLNASYMATKEAFPKMNVVQRSQAMAQVLKQVREKNLDQYVQPPKTLNEIIQSDVIIKDGFVFKNANSPVEIEQLKTSDSSSSRSSTGSSRKVKSNREYYEEAIQQYAENNGIEDLGSVDIRNPKIAQIVQANKSRDNEREDFFSELEGSQSGQGQLQAAGVAAERTMRSFLPHIHKGNGSVEDVKIGLDNAVRNGEMTQEEADMHAEIHRAAKEKRAPALTPDEKIAAIAEEGQRSDAEELRVQEFYGADGGIHYKGGDGTIRQKESTILEHALVHGYNDPNTKDFKPGVVQSPPGRLDLDDKKNEAPAKAFAQATLDFKNKNPDAEISDDTPHINMEQAMKTASLNDTRAVRNALEKAMNSLFDNIGGMKTPYVFTGKKIEKTSTVIKKLKLMIDKLIDDENARLINQRVK